MSNSELNKKEDSFKVVQQRFEEYLQKKGCRKTPERLEILKLVYAQKQLFCLDFLYLELEKKYRVSRATVYNTLSLLLECNLVKKHILGSDGKVQYEKAYKNNKHYIICTACGTAKEFRNEYLKKYLPSMTFRGFTSQHHSVYIYGVCGKCAKKQ